MQVPKFFSAMIPVVVLFTARAVHAQTPSYNLSTIATSTSQIENIIQGADGNFYGLFKDGGAYGCGGVYEMSTGGTLTTLASFKESDACLSINGYGGLVQARDGNFYGTSSFGGSNHEGAVFKVTPDGVVSNLVSFSHGDDNGYYPITSLVQASNGNLYGTTYLGNNNGSGSTVFSITPDGKFSTNAYFNGTNGYHASDLIEGADGALYGTTANSGPNSGGTIFRLDGAGQVTTLHTFTAAVSSEGGFYSRSGLTKGDGGKFYGVTNQGGSGNGGTLFSLEASGKFSTLVNFGDNGVEGLNPSDLPTDTLVRASDGNLYGSTYDRQYIGGGTIFEFSPDGKYQTLFDGKRITSLFQASDGDLYGINVNNILRISGGSLAPVPEASTNISLGLLLALGTGALAFRRKRIGAVT